MTISNSIDAASTGHAEVPSPGAGVVPVRRCVVIGSGTLAMRCIAMLRDAGFVVAAVLPTEPALATWAASEALPCVDTLASLDAWLASRETEWLFSIVNPLVLPVSLLARFRRGGFNYHDAPLPRYGGTHATSWALLAQETRHAITWHRIATAVDAGDIAVQCEIEIEPAESALSLNLKCYQAAAEGFGRLLAALTADTLVCSAQDPSRRTFFAKRRRPDAAGCLRWDHSAQALSAMVRALTFGPYHANPLTLPKMRIGGRHLWVSRLEVLPERSGLLPGTLVDVAPDHWRIATGSKDVAATFSAPDGTPLDSFDLAAKHGVMDGERFPIIDDAEARRLERAHEAVALDEAFWVARLERFDASPLPFVARWGTTAARAAASAWRPLPEAAESGPDAAIALAWGAWLLYLADPTGNTHLQLGWSVAARDDLDIETGGADCFARIVPTDIDIDRSWKPAELIERVTAERDCLARHRTYALDLVARFPSLRAMPPLHARQPWSFGLAITHEADAASGGSVRPRIAPGRALWLQIDASGSRFRLVPGASGIAQTELDAMASDLVESIIALRSGERADRAIGGIGNLRENRERRELDA
ncbi:formyltransferase family protein [Burkholderia metallica]|uniref:formyltransferase family protein n=1 Tax=Burkholderia metallica TaxID=488729 RepID=UPI001575D894|nr:formyltransferase family protein [Burkholderia metallica]NTZ10063.1 hypothetical protein [Burkholderia metallica]